MKREGKESMRSELLILAGMMPLLFSSGCGTITLRSEIPPCPAIVTDEIIADDETCFSDEAMKAQAKFCLELEELRN